MQKKSWIPTPIKLDRPEVKVEPLRLTSKWRGTTITRAFIGMGIRLLWLRIRGKLEPATVAIELKSVLERLGGLWIKVGQLLAMRRDVFGSEAAAYLGRLQDAATGFGWEHSKRIIEEDLGGSVYDHFPEISEHPFSAASIGQIHRAKTRQGHLVAVKVRRPNIEEIMTADIRWIRMLVIIAVRLNFVSFMRWNDFYYEVQKTLTEELDYRFEATNLRLMRKNLKKHDKMYAPKGFDDLSSRRVFTMEFVQGALMGDLLRLQSVDPREAKRWCEENGITQKKVADRLLTSLLRQQYEDNLFHGDLHPGNIILLKNDRVCLIDFGAVGRYEAHFLSKWTLMQQALTEGAYVKAADLFLNAMPDLPPIDLDSLKHEMAETLRSWNVKASIDSLPYEEKSVAAGFGELGVLITKKKIPISWEFLRGDRATYTLDISLRDLYPDMDYFKVLGRAQKRMEARKRAKLRNPATLISKAVRAIDDGAVLAAQGFEEGVYEIEWLRNRARIFRATPSKLAYLGMLILNFAGIAGGVGAFYLFGLYMFQHHDQVIGMGFFQPMYEDVPEIPHVIWLAIAFLGALVARQMLQLNSRFKQPEVRLPGSG